MKQSDANGYKNPIFPRQLLASPVLLSLVLFFLTIVAYLAFPSQQRNWDGAIQTAIEVTRGESVANVRHVLYPIISVPYYALWRRFGYPGDATWPLQCLNAVFGACGIVLLASILRHFVRSPLLASFVALGIAFSYGYWYFVEETWYNIMALFFLILATWCLLKVYKGSESKIRCVYAVLVVSTTALAILSDLEHLISAVAIGLGLFILPPRNDLSLQNDLRQRVSLLAFYVITLACFLIAGAMLFGVGVVGSHTASDLAAWLRPQYSVDAAPMYTAIGLERIPIALTSLVSVILPVERGLRLKLLLSGSLSLDRVVGQFALLILFVLIASAGIWLIRAWRRISVRYGIVLFWCVIWLCLVGGFAVWSDPFSLKRWHSAMIPISVALTVVFGDWVNYIPRSGRSVLGGIGAVSIMMIAVANLTLAISPDHAHQNVAIQQAECSAERMGRQDLMISSGWDAFTRYLFLYDRRTVQLLELSAERFGKQPNELGLLEELKGIVVESRNRGARVFMSDVFSFTSDQWQMMTANTGLTRSSVSNYDKRLAWQCQGIAVWEILNP